MFGWKRARFLAYGLLLGTAGVRALSSRDAKRVYTHVTAAVMRGVDDVVKTAATVKENCDDIAAEAKAINDRRYEEARKLEIEDARV